MFTEKLALLRLSCKPNGGHGTHPRVALFCHMAGWGEAPGKLDPRQEYACTQLLSWLKISSSNPPEKDQRFLLMEKDAHMLVAQLYRQRLIPERAVRFMKELTLDIREPAAAEFASSMLGGGDSMRRGSTVSLSGGRRGSTSSTIGGRKGSVTVQKFAVDADELVLLWMKRWGEWDDITAGMPDAVAPTPVSADAPAPASSVD